MFCFAQNNVTFHDYSMNKASSGMEFIIKSILLLSSDSDITENEEHISLKQIPFAHGKERQFICPVLWGHNKAEQKQGNG